MLYMTSSSLSKLAFVLVILFVVVEAVVLGEVAEAVVIWTERALGVGGVDLAQASRGCHTMQEKVVVVGTVGEGVGEVIVAQVAMVAVEAMVGLDLSQSNHPLPMKPPFLL